MLGVGSYERTMRIHCACIVVAITAALVSCETNKPKTDELSVKLDNLTSMAQRTAKQGEMRQFLWSHWTERRPANLFLTGVSREGKVTHSEYRISVSRGDTPLLQVRFVRDRAGYQGKVVPRDDGGYAACTMERVQSENPFGQDPETKITVLPRDAGVPPTKYWLRFKGWNDTLITYF